MSLKKICSYLLKSVTNAVPKNKSYVTGSAFLGVHVQFPDVLGTADWLILIISIVDNFFPHWVKVRKTVAFTVF
jgi:hypothetical protein